jgi:hypothetical protein
MRLQRCFALSLCLLVAAASGCSSDSGGAQQQPAAPVQTSAGQPAPNATGANAATTTATVAASPTPATASGTNVCALLTSDEIEAVQGEAFLEAKPNQRPDSTFTVNQCFYMTPSLTKSVSLEVTERGASAKSVHEFWEEQVEKSGEEVEREREAEGERVRKGETVKEREREREEERARAAKKPRRLKGIGDEAYWINTNANSTMYVFKKEKLLRVSIGGTDAEDARLKKIKTLAQKAVARL